MHKHLPGRFLPCLWIDARYGTFYEENCVTFFLFTVHVNYLELCCGEDYDDFPSSSAPSVDPKTSFTNLVRPTSSTAATSSFSWKFDEKDDTEDEKSEKPGGASVAVSCISGVDMEMSENIRNYLSAFDFAIVEFIFDAIFLLFFLFPFRLSFFLPLREQTSIYRIGNSAAKYCFLFLSFLHNIFTDHRGNTNTSPPPPWRVPCFTCRRRLPLLPWACRWCW